MPEQKHQIKIKQNLKFSSKTERESYITMLSEYFKENQEQNKGKIKEELKKVVKSVVRDQDNMFFNKMQLTALMTLEAAFFKGIADTDTSEEQLKAYKELYKELYGEGSEFQKALGKFNEKIGKEKYSIDASAISSIDFDDVFDAKLNFAKTMNTLFESSVKTVLPSADDNTAISFLLNIDPQILSYAIACNNGSLNMNIQQRNAKDILHEGIIVSKALCCAMFQTSGILLPPLLIVGFAPVTPVTIGIALCVLSLELAYLNDKGQLEYVQKDKIKEEINNKAQNIVDQKKENDDEKKEEKRGMKCTDIFNIPKLLEGILSYMTSTYRHHKLSFSEQIPESVESFEELLQNNYKLQKIHGEIDKIDKSTIEMFKNHSKEVGIISLPNH